MPLIPTINIGEKYRIKEGEIEDICPNCKRATYYYSQVVVIVGDAGKESDGYICEHCGGSFETDMTGWYGYEEDGKVYVVPYTILTPLEE